MTTGQESASNNPAMLVAVIGGGISGLATAYEVLKLGREQGREIQLTLLDAAANAGGVIQTLERDGFVLEQGPDCFVTNKPAGLELARELGIGGEVIGTRPEYRRSFVVHKGSLKPLPEGFFLLAPTSIKALLRTPVISWAGKARMGLEMLMPCRASTNDESLGNFVRRRFGKEALERVAQPMVAGIYTADPDMLSLRATFPNFLELEREHGSVTRALMRGAHSPTGHGANAGAGQASGPRYGLFASFKKGMRTLTDALVNAIGKERVRGGVRATGLARQAGGWRITLDNGEVIQADRIVMALPAVASSALLKQAEPELAAALSGVRYASAAIVNLAVRDWQVKHSMNGAGFVVPQVERRDLLACSFSHRKFENRAPEGHALLRAFIGGAVRPELAALDDADLVAIARRELANLIGLEGEPIFSTVTRWRESMPQYDVGHVERNARLRELEERVSDLALAGNAFDGIGIPDCIRNAKAAAKRVMG